MGMRYPCTGLTETAGFGEFLEKNLGAPRANLHAFARELGRAFATPRITLVNSGSSANLAAALALAEEAGPGAHTITAGFTFPTTMSSLLTAGFSVTAADTEPGGFNIDPAAIRRALRPETRVVCITHFLGFPARPFVPATDRERELLILEDACETMDLKVSSPCAAYRTWSFYHPHHLSAFGGGAALSSDETRQRRVESIAHWGRACTCHTPDLACSVPAGMDHHFTYVRPGHNLEMSELNAAFGRFQLATWQKQEEARKTRYGILFEALSDSKHLAVYAPPEGSGSPFVFPVTVRAGDARPLAAQLAQRGVEVRSLMGGAIVDQPAYEAIPNDGLVNCRAIARASFLVGIHQTLPESDVRDVARIVREEAH